MYFDFHLKPNESINKLLEESQRLGFTGVAVVQSSKTFDKNLINDLKDFQENFNMGVYSGVEIIAKNGNDLKKKISSFRKKVDVLMVQGGQVKINRAACEDPRIDIISQPYKKRRDCGLNHVLSKEAAKNEVAVEINLSSILQSHYSHRSKIFTHFRDILKLHRKFSFPLIITSGATSIYDLRKSRDIIRLTQCFGMNKLESIHAMSSVPTTILNRSKIRQDIVVSGVRNIRTVQ